MALYKQKGSKIWWYEFQFAGRRYRESSKTSSKQLATEAMRIFRRRLEEGHIGIKTRESPKLFPAAAEEYLAAKEMRLAPSSMLIERRAIWHLMPFFRKSLLIDISATDIKRFIDAKLAEGVSARGINMKLATLRAILRRNGAWERIRPDFKMLQEREDCGTDLTVAEHEKLLKECRASVSRMLYPVVVLGLSTGMRHGEIRFLQWSHVDLSRGILTVGKSKTAAGKGRRIPLNKSAFRALEAWATKFPNRQPEHYVFPTEKYNISKGRKQPTVYNQDPNKPVGSWKKAFEAARRRAGVKARFHDLRHTAVTRMFEAGLPLPTIAKCMGWSTSTMINMAKRYHHLSERKAKAAFQTLEISKKRAPAKKRDDDARETNGRKPVSSERAVQRAANRFAARHRRT